MNDAIATIDPAHVIAEIDPRLYGSFVEHLGRCVYGGIYEPGHATADSHGFRCDVADLVRDLRVSIVRYPGGNFVSGYNWEDGVGEREKRPRRLDLAWTTTETNHFGTNEFIDWCRFVGTQPLMAVNLGTRGMDDARRLLEYSNHPGGTALSDLRIAHGWTEPHAIKTWCLGNEMDGFWQTGHKTAEEYGRLAAETARVMRQFDKNLELVACGSSTNALPSFPEWDRIVLEHAYEQVDFISLHNYVNDIERTPAEYLATPLLLENQLRTIVALCDYMQARHRSKKTMMLCFDEWNVWDFKKHQNPDNFQPWQESPAQLEQIYSHIDTIVFGGLLITLLKQAARVRIACCAQLVNVIAPIMTTSEGTAWKQGIYYPLLHCSRYGRGELIAMRLTSAVYPTKEFGDVSFIDSVATRDPGNGNITVFAINRHETTGLPVTLNFLGDCSYRLLEHIVLVHPDPHACNNATEPETLAPTALVSKESSGKSLVVTLPRLSWNVLRLEISGAGKNSGQRQ